MEEIGQVSELWRYPVQSLQGEQLPALDFTTQGVIGDRGYCVVDDTGEGGTAARPQWKKLIGWRARYLAEPKAGADLPKVEIMFDDGTQMVSDDSRLDDAISERLGRRARLARTLAPDVKRPYVASPCHLLTSATLKALGAAYPQGRFVSQRFRPNVMLDCGDAVGFIMDVAPAPIDPALIMVTMQRDESSLAWRKRFLADTGDEFRHLAD